MDHVHSKVGEGDQGHPAIEELVHLAAERRVVVRPVDAARLDDDARQPLFDDQALRHPVRLDLGLLVVGRVAAARMLVGLVDHLALGVTERADGRDVDDAADPASRAARSAFSVPITFASYMARCSDSGIPTSYIAAPWITASQSAMPARSASLSARVPGTSSQPSSVRAAPFSGLRTSARTSSPRSRSLTHHLAADEAGSPSDEDLHPRQAYPAPSPAHDRALGPTYTWCSAEDSPRPHGRDRHGTGGAGIENPRARQRALAISVVPRSPADGDPLAELKELLRTAGVATAGELVQVRARPDPDRYLGRGKLAELKARDRPLRREPRSPATTSLCPARSGTSRRRSGVPVIDRTAVILDIFADHAHSAEGKLQVELAQLEYNLARMRGLWTHLERLGGGIGTRGPGETQIETDRRLARDRIANLRRRLAAWSETARSCEPAGSGSALPMSPSPATRTRASRPC